MLSRLTKLIGKYPKITVGIIVLITILFFLGMNKAGFRDFGSMLSEDDPRVKAYDKVDETFGGAEFVMVVIPFENLFTTDNLKIIDELTKEFEKVKKVTRVISIVNIEEVRGVEGGIEVAHLIKEIPGKERELQQLKTKILSDENYIGNIISKDGKTTAILIQVKVNIDSTRLVNDIKKVFNKIIPGKEVYLSGEPVFDDFMKITVKNDMSKLIPICLLVMLLILYLSFKSFRGIILPLSIVIFTVIWLIGLMGFTGIPFSMVSNSLPIIIISIGIADAIHILTRYREETLLGFNKKTALLKTITAVGLACFLTSITTMVGFSSLYFSPLIPIKEFGMSVTIGVGMAFIVTVTFLLAVLFLIPPFKKKLNIQGTESKSKLFSLSGILNKSSKFIIEKPIVVLFIMSIFIILAIISIPKISTDTNMISFFKKGSSVRKAYDIVKEKFSGVDTIQVVIKGDIMDPKVLKQMEEFQNKLKNIKILSRPDAIVNVLKDANQALHEGSPEYKILPTTREEAAQYMLLLSMGGAEYLDRLVTIDYTQALIQTRMGSYSQHVKSKLVKKIGRIIKETFKDDVDVVLTGGAVIDIAMLGLIWKGQTRSLAFAIIAVLIMMIIVSRSFIYGLLCTIPVSLTVLLNFGVMGWFRIPFDVATSMTSCIAIGIGIDYAIHFFSRYKEERIAGKETGKALKISITTTGEAILYNAFAVGLGFLVLIFASLPPLGIFGLLIALTMLFSSFISLTVLPALIYIYEEKFKK